MTNNADVQAMVPETTRRDLHSTLVMCDCGHSEFVHGDKDEHPCLYSVCPCSRFSRGVG
jgi:hypothetical protein